MYKHAETIEFLQSILEKELKVYTIEHNKEESFIGILKEANLEYLVMDCKSMNSREKRRFLFWGKGTHISKIVNTETWNSIYTGLYVSPEVLADIRNTLGPIKNLLAILADEKKDDPKVQEFIKKEIEKSKAAVEYLSNFQTR